MTRACLYHYVLVVIDKEKDTRGPGGYGLVLGNRKTGKTGAEKKEAQAKMTSSQGRGALMFGLGWTLPGLLGLFA